MSVVYHELVAGERLVRAAPGARHESICLRLYESILPVLADLPRFRPLRPREPVQISPGTVLRPDLTVLRVDGMQPWLIAEVVDAVDHRADTVTKKAIYEDLRLPRLWMVDPRYDNVEVYHASAFGITLRRILAGHEVLEEPELGNLRIELSALF